MLRNTLRMELNAILIPPERSRRPAIRRSRQEEWLYATDLPVLYYGTVPETLLGTLSTMGWEYRQEGNWLQLRKSAPEPPENWYTGPFGPEADCCRSLLDRHPQHACECSEAVQRMLIKAGEKGVEAYEKACAEIHREWAERFRAGRPLPAISQRYFRT